MNAPLPPWSASDQNRLLDIMLPDGGLVVALEVYMDESYSADGRIVCIAGYIFNKLRARRFSGSWKPYLATKGLPFFHMTDCAVAEGVFKDRDDCDEIARKLIQLTLRDTLHGFAVTVPLVEYKEQLEGHFNLKSSYSFALFAAMMLVRRWIEGQNYQGEVAYFFERGHEYEGEANSFLRLAIRKRGSGPALSLPSPQLSSQGNGLAAPGRHVGLAMAAGNRPPGGGVAEIRASQGPTGANPPERYDPQLSPRRHREVARRPGRNRPREHG